jgi:DNA-binding MarR family transcriptional regulator
MQEATPADPRPELFGSLFVIVQHLTRRLDEALVPLGMTSRQWLLLAVLERFFPGRHPSLTEAAVPYGTSRQNVKQVALGLERLGYLRLVLDPADRRTTRLVVTDKVRVFGEPENVARGEALLSAAFAELEPTELEGLRDVAVTWLARLQATGHGPTDTRHRPSTRPSSERSSQP